jgi:bacteriorhodopsin
MCVGLFLRISLFTTDLAIKLFTDNPNGLLPVANASETTNNGSEAIALFCKYVFVYIAECCFYFSFFAIGCDWTELCIAFRMLLKGSPQDAFEGMRRKIKNLFVWFLIVFLVLLSIFLVCTIFDETLYRLVALCGLILSQFILVFMFIVLYVSVLCVTLQIRNAEREQRDHTKPLINERRDNSAKRSNLTRKTDPGFTKESSQVSNLSRSEDFEMDF